MTAEDPRLSLLLDEDDAAQAIPLTPRLERAYGGGFSLGSPCVYANFVSSVDGVVALDPGHPDPGAALSGHSRADRFVMALLRACSEAVLVGGGTLRATPGHRWTAADVYAPAAADFAELRARLERTSQPRFVVVTARGDIDVNHPALQLDGLVITTDAGLARLRGRLPGHARTLSLGDSPELAGSSIMEVIRAEGHRTVLTEGGPNLVGHLLRSRVLDELFLTVSPVLAGRSDRAVRPGLIDGVAFEESDWQWMALLSARREGQHLFLRYRLPRAR